MSDWETIGIAACGWVIEVAATFTTSSNLCWLPVLRGYAFLGHGFTAFAAELAGAEALAFGVLQLSGRGDQNCLAASWYKDHSIYSMHEF